MAATQSSIKVIKTFTWRGVAKQWSNRYYLNNAFPDGSHFITLSDNIVNAERAIYDSGTTIIATYGYNAGSEVPVYGKTYSTGGTGTFAASNQAPGDCAGLIRYSTTQKTSKNHPIYLFNYYHPAHVSTTPTDDALAASWIAVLDTYANSWVTGFSDGTTSYKKTGPHGAVATGHLVEPKVTTHDFRR